MASIADIRTGLKNNLTAAGLTDINLYTTSNPTPPCFELDLDPEGVEFNLAALGSLHRITMLVRAVFAESEEANARVDALIDGATGTDVKAAIERDQSLGGAAQAVECTGVVPRRWKSDTTGGLLIGAEWSVTVYATGTS